MPTKKDKKADTKPATKASKAKKVTTKSVANTKASDDNVVVGVENTSQDQWATETLLTKEGYERLNKELNDLRTVKRREVAERLKEAISYWDLSENSEYEEAKNEQAFVEWRIIELEKKLKNAKIISDTHASKINVGSTVELEELKSKTKFKFTIVWSTEAEPFEWRISNESPLWKALLWHKKWDTVEFQAPSWKIKYKVLKIL